MYMQNPKFMRGIFHHVCPTGIFHVFHRVSVFTVGFSCLRHIFCQNYMNYVTVLFHFSCACKSRGFIYSYCSLCFWFAVVFCSCHYILCVFIVQLLRKSLFFCIFVWKIKILHTHYDFKDFLTNNLAPNSVLEWGTKIIWGGNSLYVFFICGFFQNLSNSLLVVPRNAHLVPRKVPQNPLQLRNVLQ